MTTPVDTGFDFVALRGLSINGVRAFNAGDSIHRDNEGFESEGWVLGEDYAEAGSSTAEEFVNPERPADNASKEKWRLYADALAQRGEGGIAYESSADLTKDQIVAHIDAGGAG